MTSLTSLFYFSIVGGLFTMTILKGLRIKSSNHEHKRPSVFNVALLIISSFIDYLDAKAFS
jgi:hypothetical protein